VSTVDGPVDLAEEIYQRHLCPDCNTSPCIAGDGTKGSCVEQGNRAKAIAALYELALLLEKNPGLPVPRELAGSLHGNHLNIHLMSSADPRGDLARIVKILPGPIEKRVWGHGDTSYFDAVATIGGVIEVHVGAYRDQVCERVVTGTREVTKTVPDPSVVVPDVEVTETVEDVEWICGPLLAKAVTT